MIELEALTRSINGLTELLRVARSDLANPILTPFERRGAYHQIDRYSVDLRRHLLVMEAERSRVRRQSSEENGGRNLPNRLEPERRDSTPTVGRLGAATGRLTITARNQDFPRSAMRCAGNLDRLG
jgi:hypothetical protein